MFWANVVQHELNYPPAKFTYSRAGRVPGHKEDGRPSPGQVLQLTVDDDVTLLVDMTTGQLTVAGTLVYDWFVGRFRQMLENVDKVFARRWVFAPTPIGELPLHGDQRTSQRRAEKTGRAGDLIMQKNHSITRNVGECPT